MVHCVYMCVGRGGWGELGLFDNVRFHVCASALHLAKHPAGTSDNNWIHSGTLLIKTHTHTRDTLKLRTFWLLGRDTRIIREFLWE